MSWPRRKLNRFEPISKTKPIEKIMRKLITVLSCCIVLLLLGYTSYRGYQVWKQSHGMAMAQAYFAKGDARNAMLSLQQVLHVNPRNIDACRLMANLTEAARSPSALVWRQRVVEIDPRSLEDRLSLAQAALIFQDYALATNTLAGVAEADKATAAYHNIAGTAALMGGQLDEAEAHFSEAIRIDPSNPVPEVNLSVVRLHRTNALDMAEARIALQRVIMTSTNASLCGQARRELINDAVRFNDMTTALALSKDLADQTNAVFSDKLLRLDVLMKTKSAEFKPALFAYQREAATSPEKLLDMTNWQMHRLSVAAALGWLQGLPIQTRTNETAEVLTAQCQLQLRDWAGLQAGIQPQNWNELDFTRHAFLARCLREQGLAEASTAEWSVALQAASGQKGSLISLFRLAAEWKWNSEAEQILWTVVNRYPEEKWAAPVLSDALTAWHRTPSLMQLLSILYKRDPDNLAVKNNLALTAMLLGEQDVNPYNLVQEVYEKDSTNASYASTYAYALYLQGKNAEALKVLQQLSPKDLSDPSIAGYYGLVLKANGNKAEAKDYLNQAFKGDLLPEEQTLFNQARDGL
jgi:Flp pilus assembly protein TadD